MGHRRRARRWDFGIHCRTIRLACRLHSAGDYRADCGELRACIHSTVTIRVNESARSKIDIALAPRNAAALATRSELREREGNRSGALADITAALSIDPANTDFSARLARLDPDAGRRAAVGALDQRVAAEPNNVALRMQRAQAAWQAGDVQRTILDLNEVITRQPRNGEAFRIRGLAHARRGDAVRTIADLTQAITFNVRDANTYLIRAEAYVRQNNRQMAIADYRRVLRLEPQNQFALNGLRRYGLNN